MQFGLRLRCVLTLFAVAIQTSPASAQQITWAVTINAPGGQYSSYYQNITTHVQAAGFKWGQILQPATNVTIHTEVEITTSIPRATGGSTTTSFVNTVNGFNIFEQGAAFMVKTGTNPNMPGEPNVRIQLNPTYMQNVLWFDPDPYARTATVPTDRNDALSVMMHELGHALAFNGWHNTTNGSFPGDYKSTYDQHVSFNGSDLFFNGPTATAVYGGPVPLTFGNSMHLGNNAPRPGQDLVPDLMNGVVFFLGQRYSISALDHTILLDSGVSVIPVPEPVWVIVVVTACVALVRARRFVVG